MELQHRESGHNTAELRHFLSPNDRHYLTNCAVSNPIIDGRPYLTLTDTLRGDLVKVWGFHPNQLRGEGIVIKRYDVASGEETYPQVRFHTPQIGPDGSEHRFTAPKDSGGVI